jgi:hypothetical protein
MSAKRKHTTIGDASSDLPFNMPVGKHVPIYDIMSEEITNGKEFVFTDNVQTVADIFSKLFCIFEDATIELRPKHDSGTHYVYIQSKNRADGCGLRVEYDPQHIYVAPLDATNIAVAPNESDSDTSSDEEEDAGDGGGDNAPSQGNSAPQQLMLKINIPLKLPNAALKPDLVPRKESLLYLQKQNDDDNLEMLVPQNDTLMRVTIAINTSVHSIPDDHFEFRYTDKIEVDTRRLTAFLNFGSTALKNTIVGFEMRRDSKGNGFFGVIQEGAQVVWHSPIKELRRADEDTKDDGAVPGQDVVTFDCKSLKAKEMSYMNYQKMKVWLPRCNFTLNVLLRFLKTIKEKKIDLYLTRTGDQRPLGIRLNNGRVRLTYLLLCREVD